MEKYLISKTEKEKYLKDYPVLECEHSIGIDYDGYISIKCKKITIFLIDSFENGLNAIYIY